MTIISQTGKKEAQIVFSPNNGGYRATIFQIVNSGIGIEKDHVETKFGFKAEKAATKWALSKIN